MASWSRWTATGEPGDRYPDSVAALKGASGLYMIRDSSGVLYVGSSRTGRLYSTMTRHLQAWSFSERTRWGARMVTNRDTTGFTYPRDRVEVRWKVLPPSGVLEAELEAIARFAPRDNEVGQVEHEAEPPAADVVSDAGGLLDDDWGDFF